jgi:N utilization substance protein B
MAQGSRHEARRAAVQALYQWQLTRQSPSEIEQQFGLGHDLDRADRDYFHQLLSQIPLHQHELDGRLTPHLDRALEEVDPVERAILRIGAYEFEFQPEVPYKVVLDEAVELAKMFGAEHGHRYVNAVLDKVAQDLRAAEIRANRSASSSTV